MSRSPRLSPHSPLARELDPTCPVRRRGGRPSRSPGQHVPVFPEARLTVRPWPDPVLDSMGHDPRSAYVEQFWLAVLGPSSLFLLRRLARQLEAEPDGFEIDPTRWSAELGLGARGGRHGPFWRSVERAGRFGLARRRGELLTVRRRLPPLTTRQAERLPPHLGQAHVNWQAVQLERPRRRTIAHWSDHGLPPDPSLLPPPDPPTVPVPEP